MLDEKVFLPAPEIVTVDVTVKEIYDALKKNGFTHLRGQWWNGNGGCVLAQTAFNLKVAPSSDVWDTVADDFAGDDDEYRYEDIVAYHDAWQEYALDKQLNSLGSVIEGSKWDPHEALKRDIAKMARDSLPILPPYMSYGLGSAIIFWNDKIIPETGGEYELKTYQDVADMAYDVLSPYFDKTVKLLQYEYPGNQVS